MYVGRNQPNYNNKIKCTSNCTMCKMKSKVLDAKRGENEYFHTLGIILVILHAIHTSNIS